VNSIDAPLLGFVILPEIGPIRSSRLICPDGGSQSGLQRPPRLPSASIQAAPAKLVAYHAMDQDVPCSARQRFDTLSAYQIGVEVASDLELSRYGM
jgi:hypothetical protein